LFQILPLICYLTNTAFGHRRFHFTSHGTCVVFLFLFPFCPLFIYLFVLFCPLLVSHSFVCYLTNKDLGHRRFYFTSRGTCVVFLFLFSFCPLFIYLFIPFCPLLVSRPFVCYLTNKDLGHRRFHFTGHGTCVFIFPSCHFFLVPSRSCVCARSIAVCARPSPARSGEALAACVQSSVPAT
jgi:hypothetical protein